MDLQLKLVFYTTALMSDRIWDGLLSGMHCNTTMFQLSFHDSWNLGSTLKLGQLSFKSVVLFIVVFLKHVSLGIQISWRLPVVEEAFGSPQADGIGARTACSGFITLLAPDRCMVCISHVKQLPKLMQKTFSLLNLFLINVYQFLSFWWLLIL